MCSDVDRQGTPLDEGLAAVIVTYVRPLICVDAVVPLQVRLAVEALPAVSVTESRTAGRDHTPFCSRAPDSGMAAEYFRRYSGPCR